MRYLSSCCDANPDSGLDRHGFGRCRACGEVTDFVLTFESGEPAKEEVYQLSHGLGHWYFNGVQRDGLDQRPVGWVFTRVDDDAQHDTVMIPIDQTGVELVRALQRRAAEITGKCPTCYYWPADCFCVTEEAKQLDQRRSNVTTP